MKLSFSWLKEYMDVQISPEKLAEILTMSGTAVERVHSSGEDSILDIEVTTNRPDCLSILGLAREVSALTGKKVKAPTRVKKNKQAISDDSAFKIRIDIEDKKGCPLYTAQIITQVSIRETPEKIKKILNAMGTRSINNVVDATNFVLFEIGQPLHAFDYDKLCGGVIIVRRARKGEKFIGIDGVEYTLDAETLIIADADRPIAIAGVMGGKLTEVSESTKNILLESAYFDPRLVRQASKKYKLSTDSSYRFERGVNIQNIQKASFRCAEFIKQWAGGQEAGRLIEKNYIAKDKIKPITLRMSRVEKILGMKVSSNRILIIMNSLGLNSKKISSEKIVVVPSSDRRDIVQEVDLIEEVLRIEGFDKVPSVIPATKHVHQIPQSKKPSEIMELKKYIAALGFDEIITYSLLSSKVLSDSGFHSIDGIQKVINAVSAEQEYFRPSLLPGFLQSVLFNVHRKASSLKFFEVGNRVLGSQEETVLGLGLYGDFEDNWRHRSQAAFYDLKGVVENILDFLKITDFAWKEEVGSLLNPSLSLWVGSKPAGRVGVVSTKVQRQWDIPHEIYFGELSLDVLWSIAQQSKYFQVTPVPKFPSVRRDIALLADEKTPVALLKACMMEAASPYLKEVELFDQYIGKNIPQGKRSLAFSLRYQKDTATFTDDEITQIQKNVGDSLMKSFDIEFR